MSDTCNPFCGFRPYSRTEGGRLFGRDEDMALLRGRLLSGKTTLLFAGSGVGKTSFLNAKVIPELEDTYRARYHSTWSPSQAPLAALLETISREIHRECGTLQEALEYTREDSVLLILDQFEEVFQYHRDTYGLAVLAQELARVAKARDLDVRIVVSMREEFLGELSAFDDLLPDLFNNYYRLKNPHWRTAGQIIKSTTHQVAPDLCDRGGLELLLEDLRAVAGKTMDAAGPENLRSQVAPTYLQIVCQRLWERERALGADKRFLCSYERGDAQKELKTFISEKLEKLNEIQRKRASMAFDHLIAAHGAKKAFTMAELARRIRLEPDDEHLPETLRILSDPTVDILYAYVAGGVSWYELRHDMYAPMLSAWSQEIFETLSTFDLGAEPKDIGKWESSRDPLDEFWVYLPHFLADPKDPHNQFFQIMLGNFSKYRTKYVYVLQTRDDLLRLKQLVENFDKEIAENGSAGQYSAWQLVNVVVLGVSGFDKRPRMFSRLLHLNNYWIANPHGAQAEGFEVVWDVDGENVKGGRPLPKGKLRQVVESLKDLFALYPPQPLESFRNGNNLEEELRTQPITHLRVG